VSGAIENALNELDVRLGGESELSNAARAELAVLQAANARMREVLRTISTPGPIDGRLGQEAALELRRQMAIDAISTKPVGESVTPAPAGAFVTLEQLREIEWANRGREENSWCPTCGGSMALGEHDDDCWLAAAILDAEKSVPDATDEALEQPERAEVERDCIHKLQRDAALAGRGGAVSFRVDELA